MYSLAAGGGGGGVFLIYALTSKFQSLFVFEKDL